MKKRRLVVILGVVALIGAVGAYAYWTQGGTGSGSAATGNTSSITVNQTSTVSGLYPGGSAVTLSGNFSNPNSFPVNISGITAAVTAVDKAGCTTGDFEIGGSVSGLTVPAGPGTVGSWSGLTVRLKDTGVNQDACKNASATITYTATGT